MVELPLFPLGSVLFPGVPLNLHIFEERYKQMITLCLQRREPFGVVLIREGREALGPLAKPHLIGCTAQIVGMQPLGQGRMFISAVGRERFRVSTLSYDRPYLVGAVELIPITRLDPDRLTERANQLRLLVDRYLEIVSQVGNIELNTDQLPDEPVQLAYWASALLPHISQSQKQALLDTENAEKLISQVRSIYRRELALLEMMVGQRDTKSDNDSSFSLN